MCIMLYGFRECAENSRCVILDFDKFGTFSEIRATAYLVEYLQGDIDQDILHFSWPIIITKQPNKRAPQDSDFLFPSKQKNNLTEKTTFIS